ncbi:HAD family hydrolase [Hymenobacter cellulosilyticus]|uniref:phosphoglycolate phosphatase n=1 Tax=Hymenobacter cellulosilyticus TaxID=2932248 RepID=A0A8T9Q2G5_9BACT|nr:HAD family hydrolase [Hymenobacter cellulosilyticus]UOQ70661.1 HAD family hydrolase [Hymenobacter cellulosilyticus]
MEAYTNVCWDKVKAVIFDVDGTLYTQRRLRKRMLRALVSYYALRPWRVQEMLILRRFRAEREKRPAYAGPNLEEDQYAWCATGTAYSVGQVRQVVQRWMFTHPNQYLKACIYPGTQALFEALRARHIPIAIYSDYPAHDKLRALGLQADLIVSSTDAAVNRLKPDPRGLLYLAEQLGVEPHECLFIGDRPELDGECARRAGMPCLIVDSKPQADFDFYQILLNQLTSNPQPIRYESDIYSNGR